MKELKECLLEITNHLEQELIPFWGKRAVDKEYSGYFTNFDKEGILEEDKAKYIVTQTRMLWGFSKLYHTYKKEEYLIAAQQGYHFLTTYFWDKCYGGWYWKTEQNGKVSDDGKVVYGQAFAIYALSEYALAAGNREAQEYAEKTFELLQKYCADEVRGGYYENMERDFSLSADGYHGGDLKSLDVHMHVMEALTMLYQCSQKKKHAQALEKVRELILKYMINQESGCGYNQFDLSFRPKPAILIHRTWNDERKEGNRIKEPVDTTSYGHNVELIWLLNRAEEVLGKESNHFNCLTKRVFEHVCRYGYDETAGGIFRDGPPEGKAIVKDKEWWQNCEMLVALLDAYEHLGDEKYRIMFVQTWQFVSNYFINHKIGEWRQLLQEDGTPIAEGMGNPWKGIYHTGRAMLECKERLEKILDNT